MLDIQFIRENPKLVAKKAQQKNIKVDVVKLLKLDKKRRELIANLENLQQTRNLHTSKLKKSKPSTQEIKKGKKYKEQIAKVEESLRPVSKEYNRLLSDLPNLFSGDTPVGSDDKNESIEKWGNNTRTSVMDHIQWLESKDAVDFERANKVAGNKFHYSKGVLAELELALTSFALDIAKSHGFVPMIVPNMVNDRVISGTGFAPKGEEKQIYKIESEGLNMIATAEIPLTAYHSDEILKEADLPLLYVGWSPCYRLEAGTYGKHSKGLFRTHQFYKVEMYVFCKPEDSEKNHENILKIEKEICQKLQIPYQIVKIASGDLGAPAYKKYDIEYWSPIDSKYRELTSCSNVTDYQARRMNIRYKNAEGQVDFVNTLNGTAVVTSRFPIAIIENNQTKDGDVKVPDALQKYMNGKELI